MPSLHTTPKNESAYPGTYTPQSKIMKALADGYFDSENTTVKPKVAVSETNECYKVELTAPGMKRENLLVNINDEGKLCVLGFMTKKKSDRRKKISTRMETFLREIDIPDYVDTAFTSATCHAGTLSIFFTKTAEKIKNRPSTIVVY